MTATEPSVREAAARAWSLIADHRAGRLPNEPGLPIGIALDMVTDSGCERETAFVALREAARATLALAGALLPGRIHQNPDQWSVAGKMVLHYLGASSSQPEIVRDQLASAERYRLLCRELQLRRSNLTHQQWRDRADWLAWADDAGLALLWLAALLAECAT